MLKVIEDFRSLRVKQCFWAAHETCTPILYLHDGADIYCNCPPPLPQIPQALVEDTEVFLWVDMNYGTVEDSPLKWLDKELLAQMLWNI